MGERTTSASCPSDEAFARLLHGGLQVDERSLLHGHVERCPSCQALLRELAGSIEPEAVVEGQSISRYRLESRVAQGGMGVVYRAHDVALGRIVAVKLLLPEVSPTPPDSDLGLMTTSPAAGSVTPRSIAEARFLREALITSRLQHPSIVPVYQAGRWPTGDVFYSMRLISGRSLRALFDGARGLDERLALLPHVLAAADAMGYAHSEGVLHRDLKPSNIMIGPFGETSVIDWGLAKLLGDGDDQAWMSNAALVDRSPELLTAVGDVVGTPAYMAPEQARGEVVNASTDVYALGGILYHLLSGTPPRSSSNLAQAPTSLREHQPDAPVELVALVDKAMRPDPAARYPSAKELAEDLRRFQTGQLVAAHTYSLRALLWRWISRHRLAVAVGMGLLGILAVTETLSVRRIVRERAAAVTRGNAVILQQAIAQLEQDPTSAMAWLKEYPDDGAEHSQVAGIAVDALSRGAALHVFRADNTLGAVIDIAPVGGLIATTGDHDSVEVRDLASGQRIARLPTSQHFATLRFSPDGTKLAMTGHLESAAPVQIWEIATGAVQKLSAHDDAANEIAWSPDGRWFASVGRTDETVRLWNLRDGSSRSFPKRGSYYRFSRDSRQLFSMVGAAYGGFGASVWRVDTETGVEQEWVRAPDTAPISRTDMSDHGERLTAVVGSRVHVWDLATRRHWTLAVADIDMTLGFSESGASLAVTMTTGTIALVNLDDGQRTPLGDSPDRITGFAISADESLVAAGGVRGMVRLWDLRTGISTDLRAATNGPVDDIFFSRDGAYLATGAFDRSQRVWRLPPRTSRSLTPHQGPAHQVAFSPDGKSIATSSSDTTVQIHDLDGKLVRTLRGHEGIAYRIAYSPDGSLLASGGYDATVRLWNPASGVSRVFHGHQGWVWPVLFSRDGKTVFSGSFDGTIRVWDVATGQSRVLSGHRGRVSSLVLSADGARLASAGEDGTARIWDWRKGVGQVAMENLAAAPSISFSFDDRWLGAALADGSVDLWEAATQTHRRWRTQERALWIVFSPSADVFSLLTDRSLEIWNVAGARLHRLGTANLPKVRLAFSPDGKQIAAGGMDALVRVWDVVSGRLRASFRTESSPSSVAFSPDGRTLATTTLFAGRLWIWRLDRVPLAPVDDAAVRAWLDELTTATIDHENRPTTPPPQTPLAALSGAGRRGRR